MLYTILSGVTSARLSVPTREEVSKQPLHNKWKTVQNNIVLHTIVYDYMYYPVTYILCDVSYLVLYQQSTCKYNVSSNLRISLHEIYVHLVYTVNCGINVHPIACTVQFEPLL